MTNITTNNYNTQCNVNPKDIENVASYSRPIKNRPGIDCLRMRHIIRIFISKIFRYIRWSINGRAIQRKYPYTHVATIICSGFAWRSL